MRPWLFKFDSMVILAIQSGPLWLHGPMLFVTTVGQPIVMIAIALIFTGVAISQSNTRLLLASSVVPVTIGVASLLKLLLQRTRPDTEYVQQMLIHTFSFPSGHAAGAMIGCGFLAYIAWHSLPSPWAGIAVLGLTLFILAVGVSRVYLGAHYPTDVIGGWLVGAVGLAIIVFVIKPLLHS
jgi:undecaprenyl-diphosphatase